MLPSAAALLNGEVLFGGGEILEMSGGLLLPSLTPNYTRHRLASKLHATAAGIRIAAGVVFVRIRLPHAKRLS